jgi:hypothetical protein
MPSVEFVGQSGRDPDNIAAQPSRLVNMYREPVSAPEGRTVYSLKSVLGLRTFAEVGGVFVRAMRQVNAALYVLCNGRVYEIADDGSVTDRGAADDSAQASISGNNGDVLFVTGGKYYRWNGTSLTEPTAGAFSSFGSVEFIGNYTVLTELNGRRFQWSDLADASDLPGLNFSTADGRDDNIIRALQINGYLYLFKETSYEVWYLTGGGGAEAFERSAGGVVDVGLKSFGLIERFDGGAAMVGDDGRFYLVSQGLQPVSTPAVETAIAHCDPQAVITYEDEGHTFLAIVFTDCPAWVYDLATGEWHERAQGDDLSPWRVSVTARFGSKWYAARSGGEILEFARTNADGGLPLVRRAVSRPLYMDGRRFVCRELEIFPRQGFAAGSVMLRLSRDSGLTWGAPKVRSWGVGEYAKRIIWRQMGEFRQMVAELTISDAIECSLNATARVEVG